MATTNVTTAVEPLLKVWYTSAYEDLTYRAHPLLGLVNKEQGGGKTISIKLKYGQNAGRSASFANAQTNESPLSRTEFLIYPGIDYSLAKVAKTDILLSQNDRGAVAKLFIDETETAMRNLGDSLERDLFGGGYGSLGSIATGGISSATVTLSTPEQAVNFYPGQVVVFAASEAASALRSSGSTGTVLSVDIDAGTVTFTATISSISTGSDIVVGDFMFQQGDKTNATAIKITGLRGWLPLAAPSATLFFGVDRTPNVQMLAGWRTDARQLKINEAINNLVTKICTLSGADPSVIMMNPRTVEKFINVLSGGQTPQYIDRKASGDINVSYKGITFQSVRGPLTVMSSPFCDSDRFYILTPSSWDLYAPNAEPIQNAAENGKFVELSTSDSVEVRLRTLAFFGCNAPGYNGVARLS